VDLNVWGVDFWRWQSYGQTKALRPTSRHGLSGLATFGLRANGMGMRTRVFHGTGGPRPIVIAHTHLPDATFCFVSYADPSIDRVSLGGATSFSLSPAGGQTVVIDGSNFGIDTTVSSDGTIAASKAIVTVGDVPCAAVVRDSHRKLRCTTSKRTGGPLDVRVTVDGLQSSSSTSFRVSYDQIVLTSVTPRAVYAFDNVPISFIVAGTNLAVEGRVSEVEMTIGGLACDSLNAYSTASNGVVQSLNCSINGTRM